MFLINCLIQLNGVPNEDRVPLILSITRTCMRFLTSFLRQLSQHTSTSLTPNYFKGSILTDRSLWQLVVENQHQKHVLGPSQCLLLLLLNVTQLCIYVTFCVCVQKREDVALTQDESFGSLHSLFWCNSCRITSVFMADFGEINGCWFYFYFVLSPPCCWRFVCGFRAITFATHFHSTFLLDKLFSTLFLVTFPPLKPCIRSDITFLKGLLWSSCLQLLRE